VIVYDLPIASSTILLVLLILTGGFEAIVAMEVGELVRDRRGMLFVRTLYALLAAISVTLAAETLLARASVDEGVFILVPALPRYLAVLPAALLAYSRLRPVTLPPLLRPMAASFLVPLLHVPVLDQLPPVFGVFAVAWLATDTVWMLLRMRAYSRLEITRNALPHIIRSIDHGICVANRHGWVLEANPAFHILSNRLGVPVFERIRELDTALRSLAEAGRLRLAEREDGTHIEMDGGAFVLQRNRFRVGRGTFTQLSLSDVTQVTRATAQLAEENSRLAQENASLEAVVSRISLEESIRARERLSRSAHDQWSQRLAVVGLSVDILLDREDMAVRGADIAEIAHLMSGPAIAEVGRTGDDLGEVLQALTHMYSRLGVAVNVSGQARFCSRQQEALCAVIREATANAVRHAYARRIQIEFSDEAETVSATVTNDSLDDNPAISEGRGLHDMRSRVLSADGTIQFNRGAQFRLAVTFPKAAATIGGR